MAPLLFSGSLWVLDVSQREMMFTLTRHLEVFRMTQPTLRRQRIVLDIVYNQDGGVTAPSDWDWTSMLNLGPDECAAVAYASAVVGSDTVPSNPGPDDGPLGRVSEDEFRLGDNASCWIEVVPSAVSLHVVVRDGAATVSAYPLGDEMSEAIESFSVDASVVAS